MSPSRQYANHPDPMDLWLETQGYYRMLTARDGSCLFRAIAEQVFLTQRFHIEVRKECVSYMRSHRELFEGHDVDGGVETYLEHMLCPTQWGGPIEITALSQLYRVNILVFKEVGVLPEGATKTTYDKGVIMLCFSHDRHYDSVYAEDFTKVAGFCQSLVYEVLYKNVFCMKDVDFAVEKMLHYKPQRHRGESGSCSSRKAFSYSCNSIQLHRRGVAADNFLDDGEVNVRELLLKGMTPFPYKVAKSLDPNIFRNVEFDVWIDYRRGLRQGYFGDNDVLQVGVKCIVKIAEKIYIGHIQEMAPDNGPVVVFVEEFGEKRTVPYESLNLLPRETNSFKHCASTFSRQRSASCMNLKLNSLESVTNNKVRSNKQENDPNGQGLHLPSARKRNASRDDHTSNNETSSDSLSKISGVSQESSIMTISNFPVDGNFNSNGEYCPYGMNQSGELRMSLPMQAHALVPPQHCSPVLIPISPRPEDVPAHWLSSTNATSASDHGRLIAGGGFPFLSNYHSANVNLSGEMEEIVGTSNDSNGNTNYLQHPQINFNAPKSIMDDGADLPFSDIQTLRFFYNLGNDVYRAQCNMQFSWGGFSQPCSVTSPSTPNPLEPTTPPISTRRKRRDSTGGLAGFTSESESPPTPPMSQSPSTASTPIASVLPRFRNKGKNKKDAKVYEGQPIVHQPTLQIPSVDESIISVSPNAEPVPTSSDPSTNRSVPFSPPYSFVYYPTSPVVPYSPVDSDPYFTPFRLQFPTDYIPDSPQSPHCYPGNGDMSVYGTTAQYSVLATSPHYLVPASPGIYVGSPPAWSPVNPATP